MTPLARGQFFRQIIDDPEEHRGWTIIHVEPRSTPEDNNPERWPQRIVYIRNDTRTGEPIWSTSEFIEGLVAEGTWIPAESPEKKAVAVDDLPESERNGILDEQRRREAIIQPIIALGREAFILHVRKPLQEEIAQRQGVSTECIRQYLSLYWQFGCDAIGLRPRSRLAGAKSFEWHCARIAPQQPIKFNKRGPKPLAGSEPGKPMERRDINLCRRGAGKFLFRPSPDHELRYRWLYAYSQTLKTYYNRVADKRAAAPTLRQFKQAVQSDPRFQKKSVRIPGVLPFLRNHRQLTSVSNADLLGPGHRGQIDDCVAKVVLIDEFSGLPIGSARFFCLIDVWSGAIAGVHDTIENSTYLGGAECLEIAFGPKETLLRELGVDIDPQYVPCQGVFRDIDADNGFFRGGISDTVPDGLGCTLSNSPSYRPDRKSDVESSFHAYLRQVAETLPGYNRIKRSRGDKDPGPIAYLTQREFRQLLWSWVALYNQRPLAKWPPTSVLYADTLPDLKPFALWSWGITHCSGNLTHRSCEYLRKALLARGQGTFTARRGLLFKHLVYLPTNEGASKFDSRGLFRSERVTVRFRKNYVSKIFVEMDGKLVPMGLSAHLQEKFGHLTFEGVEHNWKRVACVARAAATEANQARIEHLALVDKVREEATSRNLRRFGSAKVHKTVAKHSSRKSVREQARQHQRELQSKETGLLFSDTSKAEQVGQTVDRSTTEASSVKLSFDELRQNSG